MWKIRVPSFLASIMWPRCSDCRLNKRVAEDSVLNWAKGIKGYTEQHVLPRDITFDVQQATSSASSVVMVPVNLLC